MLKDIEIAQRAQPEPIEQIAAVLGLAADEIEPYGRYKAKVRLEPLERLRERQDGNLILITGMTPTPAGEGKTTMTVGLADALRRLGKRAILAIREPSMGPCFGMKGGAAGGGYSQVIPMEDINLHFTGDIHAVGAAHNLLAAVLDNHLFQGNSLDLDGRRILWKRVLDMNDRALRSIVVGLGGPGNGVPRESGFEITVASEIMAILCLARDLDDLKSRLARVIVGETRDGKFVTAGDLKVPGALALLLKDAIKPNLVQTLEGTPALVHGGPFGNIAHGCNSLIATRLALKLGEIVVTEAGFGTDLGAEKFFDIKCRVGQLVPSAAVIVATVRALKTHGGVRRDELAKEDARAVRTGIENLEKHIENVKQFGVPVVVAVNHFRNDTEAEVGEVVDACRGFHVPACVSRVWAEGGAGGVEVARAVLEVMKAGPESRFHYLYPEDLPLQKKIETIATAMYGAEGVNLAPGTAAKLAKYEEMGHGHLPVCMAKTQSSLSDDPMKLGRPRDFKIFVRDAKLAAGSGFVVGYAGDVMTMPGLPKKPAAETMDIGPRGEVHGLF